MASRGHTNRRPSLKRYGLFGLARQCTMSPQSYGRLEANQEYRVLPMHLHTHRLQRHDTPLLSHSPLQACDNTTIQSPHHPPRNWSLSIWRSYTPPPTSLPPRAWPRLASPRLTAPRTLAGNTLVVRNQQQRDVSRRRSFQESTLPALGSAYLVSKRLKLGSTPIAETTFPVPAGPGSAGVALVFGNEVDGLSGLEEEARGSLPAVYLPMCEDAIRSYNLSNAVSGERGSGVGGASCETLA